MTLYYDMQSLGKNENFVATFTKVKEVLSTDEQLSLFVSKDPNSLIFENP